MNSPTASSTSLSSDAHDPADALITQLCVGPDFSEVAASLLRQSLKARYPDLDIDPTTAMVGTCVWDIAEDQVVAKPPQYQALTDICAKQAVLSVPCLFIEGEHFLTQQPVTEPAVHLPVRIVEIANMINLLAPLMPRAFQELQLAYWNKSNGKNPQWHTLSETLRALWNVDNVEGWDAGDCEMARKLFNAPDLATRKLDDPYNSRACLIDIDQVDGDAAKHLNVMPIPVLIGSEGTREIILIHSLISGYKKFDSLKDLGAQLPHYLGRTPSREIQWRLVEPDGNFFEHQACALVTMQINVIGDMDFSRLRNGDASKPHTITPPHDETLVKSKNPDLAWYGGQLPDWLRSASSGDLTFYSRHLKDLAALHSHNAGKSWQDDILPITRYAIKALKDAMIEDYAEAAHLKLEDFEIQVKSPVIWGTFAVPGKIDITVLSLAELALQNLIGLPAGTKTLRSTGSAVPKWMTVAYIETLIPKINIGSTYPALIKAKLLDNATESARRQDLYTRHLQTQLPLLALQYKMNNEGGIDERGYRYVAAVMQSDVTNRQVEGQTIVMRPLAFVPKRRTTGDADVVANMFVIGPQDPAAGPCLLYRPMLDMSLTQYPSPSNLLYAIQQSDSLCDSVLAWLPDTVRSDYERYVFGGTLPSPWTITGFLVDSTRLWTMSGPMNLGESVIEGDLFAHLFKANANALIELADRQSVTNAESRWATFKHAGWMIFAAVLPFLGRTVGTAAWIWQVLEDLEQFVKANRQGKKTEQWTALTEVFLNLAMAITLHIATRNEPGRRIASDKPEPESPEPAPTVEKPVVVKQLPNLPFNEKPSGHSSSLHTLGALYRTPDSLGTLLDSFKISKPDKLGDTATGEGAHQHLYPLEKKWYAPVEQRWFEVSVDDNDIAYIVDSKKPTRRGPPLVYNAQGKWIVDKDLRLGGRGLKILEQRAKDQATTKAAEIRTQLTAFENGKKAAQSQLQKAEKEMTDAPDDASAEKRQLYVKTLEAQRTGYEGALQKVKSLSVFSPAPDYQQRSLGYLKAQIDLTQAGIAEAQKTFTPQLKTVLDQIIEQAESPHIRHIEDARKMSVMVKDMITRLDYMQSRFTQLKALGKDGASQIRSTRALLPSYTSDHLRALQVTLSRNLCLPTETVTTLPDAWSSIDQIVDKATIAIQSLDDTLYVRSESRLDERIDSLGSLFEQFNVIAEELQDFQQTASSQVLTEPLAQLRQQIEEFKQRALHNLAVLLDERSTLRTRPTPRPTPPRRTLKIIRTRYDGILTGTPRLTAQGLETDLVDITSPLTNKVIATYHEKTPGLWAKRAQPSPSETPDLQTSIATGQALLDELSAFNTRTSTLTRQSGRTPSGIEHLFHQHALRLKKASSNIEHALTILNLTESESTSATEVEKQLDTAADNLYTQARDSMLKMTKEQAPTPFAVEWLHLNKEITIKKTVSRRKIKGSDYLDEYTISEHKSEKILWYAHFHYSVSWSAAKMFVSARLKTVEEHARGAAADTTRGLSETQLAAYYRSEIGVELAQRLFFTK